jgi:hypothetical protein
MARPSCRHSCVMIHRLGLALSLATCTACILACNGRTTSLGGPDDAPAPSDSVQPAPTDGTPTASTPPEPLDAGLDASASGRSCNGYYTWAVTPTEDACSYYLPRPPQMIPDLYPEYWDPRNVTVETSTKVVSEYVGAAAGCAGSGTGWYYDDVGVADGGRPTRFVICPTTCSLVTGGGGFIRMTAGYNCRPYP